MGSENPARSNSPHDLDYGDRRLLEGYLKTLQSAPFNTPRLFAIGFIGLIGSGKSTFANSLSLRTGLPVGRNDRIRRYLNSQGYEGPSPRPDIMPALAEGRNAHYYLSRTSVIIDANFGALTRMSRAKAARYGASLLLVHMVCAEDIILERLDERLQAGDVNDSMAGVDNYFTAKEAAERCGPIEGVYYTVDSGQDIEPQVVALRSKLVSDGFLEAD